MRIGVGPERGDCLTVEWSGRTMVITGIAPLATTRQTG